MDVMWGLEKLLQDGNALNARVKVKCTKITSHNHNNDDYHLYVSEDSQDCLQHLFGDAGFLHKITRESQGKYRVKLDRPRIFKDTILRVCRESSEYGYFKTTGSRGRVFINVPSIFGIKYTSFDSLRSLYLASLLGKLLLANNYEVSLIPFGSICHLEKCILQMLYVNSEETSDNADKNDIVTNHYEINPFILKWFTKTVWNLKSDDNKCKMLQNDTSCDDNLKIDLKKFVEDKGMTHKFSANVNILMLSSNDKNTKQLYDLEDTKKRYEEATGSLPVACIHVTSNMNYLAQQKIELAWRLIDEEVHLSVSQLHFIYSRAFTDDLKNLEQNPMKLLQSRKSQIASAFRSKYGAKKAEFFTDEMMEEMAKASLRFEFLSIKPTLETRISHQNSCFEDRSGVFIFYNYARIATLLDKFNKLVEEGLYPSLIAVEEVDFHLLKQEEEWRILFNYILEFPNVVKDSITRDSGGAVKGVTTQKICQFLSGLSNYFSKYYSKTHILTDPLPHLVMTMHARLYLVKSVKQVFDNALNILSIQPLQRL